MGTVVEQLKGVRGFLHILLKDEHGNVKLEREDENLLVTVGLAHIASRMKDTAQAAMTHMAVGTGTTDPAMGDTTLQTETARVALTSSTIVTTNVTNDSLQHVATFGAGVGTGALTEAGILNNSSGGTLQSRVEFSVINKGALDSLTITWKLVIA
jgi:hypothetical protein